MSEEKSKNITSLESMALVQANNYLAVHLHRLLAEEKKNVFFSPFSISSAMAMVLYAATDETEDEMRRSLGYANHEISKDDIISTFQQFMSHVMKSTDSYTLSCANSVLTQKNFEVKAEYKTALTESFKALVLEVDFSSDREIVIKQINDWVKEKTNGMIPNLIKSLDPETVIVLLNAVYFKGNWLHKFNKDFTFQHVFYNHGKEDMAKTVDMMRIKETFPYTKNDSFQALQLPYAGDDIAMLILLPESKNGLERLEEEMTSSFVHTLAKKMRKKKVIVNLPRFRLQYSKTLVSCFQKLGINRLFEIGAQLGGASDSSSLAVSDIIHEAVLEVNEEGCEAAAATKIAMVKRCATHDPHFIVDHPFIIAIYDTKSTLILFMGRVEEL